MRDYRDAKLMARSLRQRLAAAGVDLSHSECLELVASQFGCANWNVLAAAISRAATGSAQDSGRSGPAVPILRIFSREKAAEFYLGFLGFGLDWPDDAFTASGGEVLYAQISRGETVLHLSEHHGDGSPGAVAFVPVTGIDALQRELIAKDYPNMRPGIESLVAGSDWQTTLRVMEVIDPFGNRLRFGELAGKTTTS